MSDKAILTCALTGVLTNPDMLNTGLLPAHGRPGYTHLLRNVRYVVIDEMHVYRGAFGAQFSNLMRRLLRICRHYGSNPQFLCSSATIANPAQLAETLCHKPFSLVDDDGSPSRAFLPCIRVPTRCPTPMRRTWRKPRMRPNR